MGRLKKPAPVAPAKRAALVTPERMAQAWHSYPKLTLATIGAVIAILTSIAPFVTAWLGDFVRRPEFNLYKSEVLDTFKYQAGKDAWRDVRAIRMEATVARNRVNDCDLLKERQTTLSPLERATCAQYLQEMNDANRRLIEAQATARAATTKEAQ
jgi:hypothetical protein